MVRVTFWLQLLLLFFILRQSDADCDQWGDSENETSSSQQDILQRLTKLEQRNEILKQPQAKQTVMNCHIGTGKQMQANIVGFKITEKSNKEMVEELREKQKQLHATIGQQTQTDEANNQRIQELREKQKQLQATSDFLTKTMEAMIESEKLLPGNKENACRHLLDAVKSGEVNTVKILAKGTNDNCTTHDNVHYTPLMFAAANRHVDLVRVLLEGGAGVESTNDYQWTTLHVAAFYGHLDVCRLLLDRGAKVDPLDMTKETPLHHAAMTGYLSVLKLLVEKGANVRIKNDNGQTASDVAWSEGYSDVADWLNTQVLR